MEISEDRRQELARVLEYFELNPMEELWPILNKAMIHRSYRAEASLEEDNERLEFLGDSVIGLVTTEYLLIVHSELDEGRLSKMRASVVSRQVLGKLARQMKLGELILLGTGEERSGGRDRSSILGSALEAVMGALYVVYPWRELSETLVRNVVMPGLQLIESSGIEDFKSQLQEWAQRESQRVPEYRVVAEGGPDHQKHFEVEVSLAGKLLGWGSGKRKKIAENKAACDALQKMGIIPAPDAD